VGSTAAEVVAAAFMAAPRLPAAPDTAVVCMAALTAARTTIPARPIVMQVLLRAGL